MAQNAIVTLTLGEKYSKVATMTHPSLKAYAVRLGADFIVIDKEILKFGAPHFEKFQIFNLLNRYNRIIYLDTDMIVRDDCPNLFDVVPDSRLGIFNESVLKYGRDIQFRQYCEAHGFPIPAKWQGQYYNTGVMVISRLHKYLFDTRDVVFSNISVDFWEQSLLNYRMWQQDIKIHDLDYRFNRMEGLDRLTGEDRKASWIIHYAGAPTFDLLVSLIEKDQTQWLTDSPNYRYDRNVVIEVWGGLGDQVSVEPAIREMERLYAGDKITVITDWPEIYQHHSSDTVRVGNKYTFKAQPNTPYYKVKTMLSPEHDLYNFLPINTMHPVDHSAMNMFRRTLSPSEKTIKMKVDFEDITRLVEIVGIDDLTQYVAVHPGRGWPSKTFPASWWNEVIKGLKDAGLKVAVIGKHLSEEQGMSPIEIPEGVLDLRNLLDTKLLFAFVSQVKVLVSNDSAPVHIAGAFDTWIVLIPTCKRPEHVLPFRNGTQSYHTISLYSRLLVEDIDSRPTRLSGQTIDWVPGGDILKYLPKPEDVIKTTVDIFKQEGQPKETKA